MRESRVQGKRGREGDKDREREKEEERECDRLVQKFDKQQPH